LMALALSKNQGHCEGAFGVEDENNLLYEFLHRATRRMDRSSSHFIGRCKPWTGDLSSYVMASSWHQGITVSDGLLPAEKRHLLFGQVQLLPHQGNQAARTVLFLKLENWGLDSYYHISMHGLELVQAQANKRVPGSDDLPEMAKERVPANVLQAFGRIMSLAQGNQGALNVNVAMSSRGFILDPMTEAKKWGIAYMLSWVDEATTKGFLSRDQQAQFHQLLDGLDHPDKRTGREVYLTHAEIVRDIGAHTSPQAPPQPSGSIGSAQPLPPAPSVSATSASTQGKLPSTDEI
jgi:hypothetical protein